ncbi:hypothetical protein HDU91_004637, partial [Kappamyces sp. JEL0680]
TKLAGKDGKLNNSQLQTFLKKVAARMPNHGQFTLAKPLVTQKEIVEACEWADISQNQNLVATIGLICTLGSEGGQTPVPLVKAAFDFLTQQDTSAHPSFVSRVKELLGTLGYSAMH